MMRTLYLSAITLVFSTLLTVSCQAAELKGAELPQVKPAISQAPDISKTVSTLLVVPDQEKPLSGKNTKQKMIPGTRATSPQLPVVNGISQPTNSLLPSKSTVPSRALPRGTKSLIPQASKTIMAAPGISKSTSRLSAINITSPKQGDFMVEGDQFVIQWSGIGNIQGKCFNINLHKGMMSHDNMNIAENICVNGFNWQIPQGTSGTGFKIRVRSTDNAIMDNSDTFSILSSQPDLRITNLHIQPATPDMRDDITVVGEIQNAGHGTSASNQAIIRLQSGNWTSNQEVLTIPTFVFGPGAHLPFNVTFPPPHGGPPNDSPTSLNITADVTVDTQNQVAEADEGNNSEQLTFAVTPLPNLQPNLVHDLSVRMSTSTKINFQVTNNSLVPIGPTVCRTWIEKKGHETHNVPALSPGQDYQFHRSVIFGLAGWRNYSLTVDYGDTVRESHEQDNAKSDRIHARNIYKLPPEEEARFPLIRKVIDYWF